MQPPPFTFFLAGQRGADGRFTPYTQELYRRDAAGAWEHLGTNAWVGCDEPDDVDPLTHDEAVEWRSTLIGARTVAPWADTSVDFPHDLPEPEPEPQLPLNRYDRFLRESEGLRRRIMVGAWALGAVVVLVVALTR